MSVVSLESQDEIEAVFRLVRAGHIVGLESLHLDSKNCLIEEETQDMADALRKVMQQEPSQPAPRGVSETEAMLRRVITELFDPGVDYAALDKLTGDREANALTVAVSVFEQCSPEERARIASYLDSRYGAF